MYPYKIFGLFTLYGLMIGIGVTLAFVVVWTYCKKARIESKFVDFMSYALIVSVIVGFFMSMVFQSLYEYIEDPSEGFHINGSMTFIGGIVGGAAMFFLLYFPMRKRYQSRFLDVSSIIPCAIMLGGAFGRIGCFCAGCCYGIPTDSFWGVTFVGMTHPVYPTQLFESAFLFALFGLCSFFFLKFRFRYNFPVFMFGYGLFRYLIEFIRGDERGALIPGMSPSQFWSILLMAFALPLAILMYFMYKKRNRYLIEHPVIEPVPKVPAFFKEPSKH
jgi:phosphatidylglycerol:prolipoprotein diacylglycerol transferase